MSAPSANSHSWYTTKNEGPGQQGFANNSHLYNRTLHHVGPATDQAWQQHQSQQHQSQQHQSQQPHYNWYSPASKSPLNTSHPPNSGTGAGNSWNWGSGAIYQQQPIQYGQPFQQNTQQYSAPYRNPNVLPVARPNPDPWNWGWEESGVSANSASLSNSTSSSNPINNNNNNNNVSPDPVWGWSVDSTATHQEHNVPSTNAGYSSAQHGQNYTIAPMHVSVNTGSVAAGMTPSTAALIAESFSSGSADQTPLFSSSGSQNLAGNKNPLTLNFVRNNVIHPVVNSGNQYTAVSTPSHFNQDVNYSHGSHGAKGDFEEGYVNSINISQQGTYTAGASEERLGESHIVTQEVKNVGTMEQDTPHPSADCVSRGEEFSDVSVCTSETKTEKGIKEGLDSPANDVPELSRGSSSREQDISKQSSSTGNDGLSTQWSTESLPSSEDLSQTVEGSEVISPHSNIPQLSLVTDTLLINQQSDQYHQSYEHSTYEFSNDDQNSRHVERTEEPQCLKDVPINESRNLCTQEYPSYGSNSYIPEQVTNETATWKQGTGNRGYSQDDIYGQMSSGGNISTSSSSSLYLHSDCHTAEPETMMNIAHISTETIKTTLPIESVASALENLTVSNENLRSPDVENKEIVYPETEENLGATSALPGHSNLSHGSNVTVNPTQAALGPPPKSTGIFQKKNNNPYSLTHKPVSKYRASPPSGEGAAGGVDKRNYNHPHTPLVGPTEPSVNVAQFGALPEIMSHTINTLMQPTYSLKTVETSGNIGRKKKTPPPMAEDVVNLETVPDNKERPDFVDVLQTAPVTRLHAAAVGQDALRGTASQWTQPSSYSVSPENQEVAPHCGPDRNQYLETGQLTGDEREIRSTMPDIVETQYRVSRNGNSSVSHEGFLPLHELHRMVPGQITEQNVITNSYEPENMVVRPGDNFNEGILTPPPGLHRMVPGQFTETENTVMQVLDSVHTTENSSDDLLLDRMVPGQLTEESGGGSFVSESGSVETVPAHSSVDDIPPPPGLRRMVPGESSSPESQGIVAQLGLPAGAFQPIDAVPLELRVVTGVAQDEVDGVGSAATLPLPASPLSVNSRVKSEPVSPTPEQTASGSNLPQPPSERSETIGSDSVEVYTPPAPSENTVRDASSSRRDTMAKDRERWHQDDEGNEHNSQHQRRQTDGRDFYASRDKDRAESPGASRYKDREEWDWKYGPRHERDRDDSSSGGRYRDDRHYDPRKEYRDHDDSRRPRRKRNYNRQEDDADTEDYFSDHDRDRARYHDQYDVRYRDRTNRERGLREMENVPRERQDHRTTGRDRDRDLDRDRDGGRDRNREKKRQEDSDRHDYRRSDDYYNRGYEDDQYFRGGQRSRPSSRAEYEEYRRRDFHGYGAYNYFGRQMDSYHYDPYYTYKYYENLRRTNPTAYAEWYAKYYSSHPNYNQGAFSEDRGSVHSGRSSANEELPKDRGLEHTDSSIIEDPTATTPQRLTPAKFSTAHIKGVLTARGQVVKILPHYPLDGQPATVEIHDMQGMVSSDETVKELQGFPGPLVRGVTHKNSVIAFCMRKLKKAERDPELFDRESVILLWKLLILLLRQNGTVVGADIAELLLSNSGSPETTNVSAASANVRHSAPSPAVSQPSSIHDVQTDEPDIYHASYRSEEELTVEFREYLLYGNKKEALEWAMRHGLWGHALFLASKMDQRTYANVMMRFANGLAMNDPLQTLYQLMSGRQPAAVTCCADEKWGDWKPHLAMILSNPSQRPDLDHKAVITLGDTLGVRGCLHASHFCYLMAQLEFGVFSHKSSKIVLLGSSHFKPFVEFATNEAIQMTEIYIYACQLAEHDFNVPQFQAFKYLYAKRLAEFGMLAEAIHYVEVIAEAILQRPTSYSASFTKEVYELGDQLKYYDPVYSNGDGEAVELADPSWLHGLHSVIDNYNIGIIQQDIPSYSSTSNLSCSEGEPVQHGTTTTDTVQDSLPSGTSWNRQQQELLYSSHQHTQQWPVQQDMVGTGDTVYSPEHYCKNSEWATGSVSTMQDQAGNGHHLISPGDNYPNSEQLGVGDTSGQRPFSYWDVSASRTEDRPRVTLPGSASQTLQQEPPTPQPKPSLASKSSIKQKQEQVSKPAGGTSSWLGGIWNRFTLRPTNQMKLPDDKNPSIVWDSDKKRWTNVDGDDEEGSSDLPPPPKASELPAGTKGLSGRKPKYVDVLKGSKITNLSIPAPDIFPPIMPSQTTVNYFIPSAVESSDAVTDFLTPTAANIYEQPAEHSQGAAAYSTPKMFDPASFSQKAGVVTTSSTLKHYPN